MTSLRLLHPQLDYSTLLSIFRQVPTLLFPWISLYCLTNLNTILFLDTCNIVLHKYYTYILHKNIFFRERNKKMLAKSTVRWKNLSVHCTHFILCPFEECCFLFPLHDCIHFIILKSVVSFSFSMIMPSFFFIPRVGALPYSHHVR